MNREEAIYFANSLKNNYTVDLNDMEAFCDMAIKALAQEPVYYPPCIDCNKKMDEIRSAYDNMTIKAFEQEPILDKIRAEIDGLRKDPLISWASSEMIIDTILKIIDKYKAESESEE